MSADTTRQLTSPEEWVRVRHLLNRRRHGLAILASTLYPNATRVAGTGLLCRSNWLPPAPLELDTVGLEWLSPGPPPLVDGTGPISEHLRSVDGSGHAFGTYAETLGALAKPAVFENRAAYRLLSADLAGGEPRLRLCQGQYFDGVNVGEAAAHELAELSDRGAAVEMSGLPLRSAVGDPCDLSRRPTLPAISTLTIRYDRVRDVATFILHWRDPAKVAHAGGLYQVMPVGVFQPSVNTAAHLRHDLNLWRCMVREFNEEFLGHPEDYPITDGMLDYEAWPFYRAMTSPRKEGKSHAYVLGLGVDPLTWATDVLTAVVFDSECFDELFHDLVRQNAEGAVIGDADEVVGIPFDRDHLAPLIDGTKPMQAAGSAALALAWRFQEHLLPR